jgi:hypothetical protein
MKLQTFTPELPTITREFPNKYTGIISIHRLGNLYN